MTEVKEKKKMWSSIHHDRRSNRVFVWYTDGKRLSYPVKHRFFTPNRGEYGAYPCGMKDIYDRPMYEVITDGKTEGDIRNQHSGRHNQLAECDVDFRTRWLQNQYEDQDEIRFNPKDINTCFIDIEVATKGKFPTAEKAEYPVNCVTIYLSKIGTYYTFGLNREIKEETAKKLADENCVYINCKTEVDLLNKLFMTIGDSECDILTGWNCVDVNSNIWLKDRITKMKNVTISDVTHRYGNINIVGDVECKVSNILKLVDGSSITASNEHKFPVYIKPKHKYCDIKSIGKYERELTTNDIKKIDTDTNDIFFKKILNGNSNADLSFRKLLLDNLNEYLSNPQYNFVLNEIDIKDIYSRLDINDRPVRSNSWKDAPNYYSITRLIKLNILTVDDVIQYIRESDTIAYKFDSVHYNVIDLDDIISYDMLHLLGLHFADGTYNKKDRYAVIYNTDKDILSNSYRVINSDLKCNVRESYKYSTDGTVHIQYGIRKSAYGLLFNLIYNHDMDKSIHTELISTLSRSQYLAFFNGCVDGDGWINSSINLCNYNGDDLYQIQELNAWNGIVSTVHSNHLRVKLKNQCDLSDFIFWSTRKQLLSSSIKFNVTYSKNKNIAYLLDNDNNCIYTRLRSIDIGESIDVMDISTDSHYFTCQGIKTHNCDFYDFPYLVNRSDRLGVDIRPLSRLPMKYKCAYVSKRTNRLEIGGTETIDFLQLYKKYTFSERDNFKLDTIGEVEVGERKSELPDGYMSWINYWDDFVLYNFQDVKLMKRIEDKCRMFETTVTACSEARVPFSAIFESKKMLVGFLLNYLHKKGLTLPPLRENEREWFPGAYVYSTPGYYDCLVSYDYRSMYPSIMMGANVSPETKVTFPMDYELTDEEKHALVRSPWTANGQRQVYYRKDKVGIVPQVVKILFDGRSELKESMFQAMNDGDQQLADYYDMKQKTYKILGNSLYGLLGNPYFQLYDIDNSATITALGRELIITTIKDLNQYFTDKFKHDKRFEDIFGHKPTVDPVFSGTFENEDGDLAYNRMSHGDTDSFFVKYEDFYSDFAPLVGKKLDVIVFEGNQMIEKHTFDLSDDELDAKKAFNVACTKYSDEWSTMDDDRKKRAYVEGILFAGKYRVIYNRNLLTDFCRILDAGLMEDTLADIMQNYANHWNYRENTIFLKREKCIHQAIVTRKKKYICRVESNEDKKYFDKKLIKKTGEYKLEAKFAVTGMEIVRSSTTPFARERILTLIHKMFDNMDKGYIRAEYLKIKSEFYECIDEGRIYEISIPSGVKKNPPKWEDYVKYSSEDKKAVDWRLRSASVWNYLIETDPQLTELPLEPIFESAKVKFIKVAPNRFNIKSIAYVGDSCPPRLLEIFTPDWDEQWLKNIAQTMDKIFIAVGWGKNLEHDESDNLVEFL